ncbi:MAG TPA: excisionase family DNA-binding protein [Mycobacteriales bacterium]|nr:excisionase family DNA-binding protein [Mycobacteriales bacterium]
MSVPALAEVRAVDAERSQVRAVRALVGTAAARVRVRVGDHELDLPRSLVRILVAAAGSLDDGDSVAIVAEEAEVSPAQAARLLGVSRQYVDRLVGAGVLPARRLPGSSYRRIPVRAVLAHRGARSRKREGIRKVVADATAAGLEY